MLPAYKGRINRKTFILGNAIGLGALSFAALLYIVPVAIFDIMISAFTENGAAPLFKVLYSLFLIPCIFYFFFFTVLFVKRLHDIGYPGMLILWVFIGIQVGSQLFGLWQLHLISLAILLAICALPGQKGRNNFGPKPSKKFRLQHITVRF